MSGLRTVIAVVLLVALTAAGLLCANIREQQGPAKLGQPPAMRIAEGGVASAELDGLLDAALDRANVPEPLGPQEELTPDAPESGPENERQSADSYFIHPANHNLFDHFEKQAESPEWSVSAGGYRSQLFLAISIIDEFERGPRQFQSGVELSMKRTSDTERVFALNGRIIRFDVDEYSEYADFEAYVAESRRNPPGSPVPVEIAGAIKRRVDYARALLGPRGE